MAAERRVKSGMSGGGERRTWAKVAPLSCGKLDGIQDEDFGTGAACELCDGGVNDVVAALYWTIQGESGLCGCAKRRRIRGTMLGLWMEGDEEFVESIVKVLGRRRGVGVV